MRAYRLRNGQVGVPIRIEYMLDRQDLCAALAYSERNSDPDEDLPDLSDTAVHTRIRETLYDTGPETCGYWADYAGGADREDTIADWAERHIDRVYGPALAAPVNEARS